MFKALGPWTTVSVPQIQGFLCLENCETEQQGCWTWNVNCLVPGVLISFVTWPKKTQTTSIGEFFELCGLQTGKPNIEEDRILALELSIFAFKSLGLLDLSWARLPGPDMPFIGGSEGDFTNTLQRVDSELGANTVPGEATLRCHQGWGLGMGLLCREESLRVAYVWLPNPRTISYNFCHVWCKVTFLANTMCMHTITLTKQASGVILSSLICCFSDTKESPFFLPYQHPTIVDMQYVSHVERAVASAMCHASVFDRVVGFRLLGFGSKRMQSKTPWVCRVLRETFWNGQIWSSLELPPINAVQYHSIPMIKMRCFAFGWGITRAMTFARNFQTLIDG